MSANEPATSELTMLRHYLRIAFAVYRRRKLFTFVSLFGTCFTLVVLMVAAAAIDAELGAYPPEVRGDRTLSVSRVMLTRSDDPHTRRGIAGAGYLLADRYLRHLQTPERIAVYTRWAEDVMTYLNGDQVRLRLRRLDGACWEVLQCEFLEGRPFSAQEDAEGASLAVISQATRDRLFGSAAALGRTFRLGGRQYQVIGVVRTVSDARAVVADVWVPLGTVAKPQQGPAGLVDDLTVLLQARSPVDFPAIRQELAMTLAQVDLSDAAPYDRLVAWADTPLDALAASVASSSDLTGDEARFRLLLLLCSGALLFMLLPALNLVNLNISRILERGSEIGVRRAFGAPRHSLVWQFLVENLVLILAGSVMGGLLSVLVLHAFSWWGWAYFAEFHFNLRVFLCGLAVTLVFGLLSGAYPAWRMARLHPVAALRGERR
ncbi:MAG: FtsX-like permease family protein [Candidatus Latescibacterota bacterium]|jgi:putative ABC transport system permease protein